MLLNHPEMLLNQVDHKEPNQQEEHAEGAAPLGYQGRRSPEDYLPDDSVHRTEAQLKFESRLETHAAQDLTDTDAVSQRLSEDWDLYKRATGAGDPENGTSMRDHNEDFMRAELYPHLNQSLADHRNTGPMDYASEPYQPEGYSQSLDHTREAYRDLIETQARWSRNRWDPTDHDHNATELQNLSDHAKQMEQHLYDFLAEARTNDPADMPHDTSARWYLDTKTNLQELRHLTDDFQDLAPLKEELERAHEENRKNEFQDDPYPKQVEHHSGPAAHDYTALSAGAAADQAISEGRRMAGTLEYFQEQGYPTEEQELLLTHQLAHIDYLRSLQRFHYDQGANHQYDSQDTAQAEAQNNHPDTAQYQSAQHQPDPERLTMAERIKRMFGE